MALVKAKFQPFDTGGGGYEVQFNPETYSLSKGSDWKSNSPEHEYDSPVYEWKGGGAMKLELTLVFDTYQEGSDVRKLTNPIEELALVHPEIHRPPRLKFVWGGTLSVKGSHEVIWVLSAFNTTYKMFDSRGIPVRAEMKVTLTECPPDVDYLKDRAKLQSPDYEKAYRVRPGDTLQSIAFELYDDPSQWRPIASANNIENPQQLEVGAVLRIPRTR